MSTAPKPQLSARGKRLATTRALKEFEKAARPLVKYLSDKHHPHNTAVVTSTGAELVEGVMNVLIPDYIKF